jgi:hypothetical protein
LAVDLGSTLMFQRQTSLQTNLASGEIDALMRMRSDVKGWRNGAKVVENFRGLLQGGQRSRPPLQSVVASWGTVDGQLLEFEFDGTQGYVMKLEGANLRIRRTSDGADCGTLSTPYAASEIREVSVAQSGDVLLLFHKNYQPRQVTRTGATTFTIATWDFDTSGTPAKYLGPFYRYEASSITLTPSATTGTITVTASTAIFTDTSWNGLYIRIGGKQVLLGTRTSDTVMGGCTVVETLANTSATTDWQEQVYSAKRGWPICACFHDDRLVLGGGKTRRQGLYLSQVGSYKNFDSGTGLDAQAIWTGISVDKVQDIRRVVSHQNLLVFTDQLVAYCPQSETKPLTPATISIRPQANYGITTTCNGKVFDGAVSYAQTGGKVMRELIYNDTIQAYSAEQTSVFTAQRVSNPQAIAALPASASIPEQYLFVVMDNGGMAVLHSLRSQQLTGWTFWTTPNGLFKSVAVVNNEAFVLILRGTTYSLEKFRFDVEASLDGFTTHAAAATFASGVLGPARADGKYDVVSAGKHYGTLSLSGGVLTPDVAPTGETYIGIGWSPTLETLPPEIETPIGSLHVRPKRLSQVSVTIAGSVSVRANGQDLDVWDVAQDPNTQDRRKSNTYHFRLLGWKQDPTVTLGIQVPLPVTILGFATVVGY